MHRVDRHRDLLRPQGRTASRSARSPAARASTDQVAALVEQADAAARARLGRRGRGRAGRRRRRRRLGRPQPEDHLDHGLRRLRRRSRARRSAQAEAEDRILYGFVDHDVTTTYLGSATGLRLRHVQPTGHYGCTGKTADLSTAPGSAARPATSRTSTPPRWTPTLAQRLGWGDAAGRPAGWALRHDPAARRGRRPDDLRLLGRAARAIAHEGQSVFSQAAAAAPGSASRSRKPGVQLLSDPPYAGLTCAPFVVAASSTTPSRLRQRPAA